MVIKPKALCMLVFHYWATHPANPLDMTPPSLQSIHVAYYPPISHLVSISVISYQTDYHGSMVLYFI